MQARKIIIFPTCKLITSRKIVGRIAETVIRSLFRQIAARISQTIC